MGIDNNIDWTAANVPQGEQYGRGLARKSRAPQASSTPAVKRLVMDKLLGENNLAAFDAGGADPYNTTGKQFRR
jgi:hypothetical protein